MVGGMKGELLKLFKSPHRHIAMELQKADSPTPPTLKFY